MRLEDVAVRWEDRASVYFVKQKRLYPDGHGVQLG